MLIFDSIQSMDSPDEEPGNGSITLQTIPHLFNWEGEFSQLLKDSYHSKTVKERTDLLLDGFLQSPNIINMYMVFEAFDDLFTELKFDRDHVTKLVEFKNKNGFGHIHPYFLCNLRFLKSCHRYFLDMLLRCEDLVSTVKSKKVESNECVSVVKFVNQNSIYSFFIDECRFKVHVKGKPRTINAFDILLESDTLKAESIHLIFRVVSIYKEKLSIGYHMAFQSWKGAPMLLLLSDARSQSLTDS